MTNYSQNETKKIAQVSPEQHIGILTQCGINRDNARKLIGMSTPDLKAAVEKFGAVASKSSQQAALIAAAAREIVIRQG